MFQMSFRFTVDRETGRLTVMRKFIPGDMVMTIDRYVGMYDQRAAGGRCWVKFGADGPIYSYDESALRWATEEEIVAAGLEGVGRNPTPTEGKTIRMRHKNKGGV